MSIVYSVLSPVYFFHPNPSCCTTVVHSSSCKLQREAPYPFLLPICLVYLSSPHRDSDILLCQILALVLLVSQQYLTINIVTYFLLFLRTLIEILLSRTIWPFFLPHFSCPSSRIKSVQMHLPTDYDDNEMITMRPWVLNVLMWLLDVDDHWSFFLSFHAFSLQFMTCSCYDTRWPIPIDFILELLPRPIYWP